MNTLIWNVKDAETLSQAVTNMRHGFAAVSPQCVTRCKTFGHTIKARRHLQTVMAELQKLAADDYYLKNSLADYTACCEKYFEIKQRRGYVQLVLKGNFQ